MGLESELEEDQSDEGSTKEWSLGSENQRSGYRAGGGNEILGVIISSDGRMEKEVEARIASATIL